MMQEQVYEMPVQDVADLRQCLIDAHCKALCINGIRDFSAVWRSQLNTCAGRMYKLDIY